MRVGWVALTWWASGASAMFALANWALGHRARLAIGLALVMHGIAAAETWLLPWAERALERRRRAMR